MIAPAIMVALLIIVGALAFIAWESDVQEELENEKEDRLGGDE